MQSFHFLLPFFPSPICAGHSYLAMMSIINVPVRPIAERLLRKVETRALYGLSKSQNRTERNHVSHNSRLQLNSSLFRLGDFFSRSISTSCVQLKSSHILDALQTPAGPLYKKEAIDDDSGGTTEIKPVPSDFFIPEVALHDRDGRNRKRVLV